MSTRHLREKQVEADIIRALKMLGFGVTKTSQPQRARGMTRGIPDLYAVHERWQIRLWIEVKAGDNGPTPHQLAWHARERAAGGHVVVARSLGDILQELVRLGLPLNTNTEPSDAS